MWKLSVFREGGFSVITKLVECCPRPVTSTVEISEMTRENYRCRGEAETPQVRAAPRARAAEVQRPEGVKFVEQRGHGGSPGAPPEPRES